MARISRKFQLQPTTPVSAIFSAAVYVRLSLEDNNLGDGFSIEAQKEMLVAFVSEQGDMKFYDIYCDNGFTGSNFDRDDFNRMMEDIRSGKVNAIVVKDLSRFGRNYIETGNYIEKIFPFMGVRFVSVNDGYDSEKNDASDIMVTLRNIVNHAYVTDISRKIKTMFDTKQKNGDFIGWSAPYGYLKSEENNNRLVIDPETAPTVKQMFEWKAEGLSYVAIARKLNEMGIPSPRKRNIARGRYKTPPTDGLFWSDASVAHIIKNPVFAGHMAQHKFTRHAVNGKQQPLKSKDWVIVRDTHAPIVSEELWAAAQAATKKNADTCNALKDKRRTGKSAKLFKRILYCPHCNRAMAYKNDSRGKNCNYYDCAMRRANPNCTTPFLKERELIDVVFAAVKKEITAAADVRKLLDKISKSKNHLDKLNSLQQNIRNIEMRIKRNGGYKTAAFSLYADGTINAQEFKDMKDSYDDEAENLQSELAEIQAENKFLSSAYSKENKHLSTFLKFKNPKALTREMLVELIAKIIVHDADRLEIVWQFEDEYRAVCELAKAGEQS